MSIFPGQGLLLKAFFADGSECSSARTFLVIENTEHQIKALNVSSIKGKEAKLAYDSNLRILRGNPPFNQPSFVKLDSLYIFENCLELRGALLSKGNVINPEQLLAIKSYYSLYSSSKKILTANLTKSDLLQRNTRLSLSKEDVGS